MLGGIWFGFFTPTESAGMGEIIYDSSVVSFDTLLKVFFDSHNPTTPNRQGPDYGTQYRSIAFYNNEDEQKKIKNYIDFLTILIIMVLTWFVLGMFIDSVSIILLTVPLFTPIANNLGYDPIAFAIIGIVAIEAGLLTPPLGLCVYTVKGSVSDPEATLGKIFLGSVPYWILLIVLVFLIAFFPSLATWLPSLM